jgi:hypothetical protein
MMYFTSEVIYPFMAVLMTSQGKHIYYMYVQKVYRYIIDMDNLWDTDLTVKLIKWDLDNTLPFVFCIH